MLKIFAGKLKESVLSVAPVILIVTALYFTPLVHLELSELLRFLVSGIFLIVGMALFNMGADKSMIPMGDNVGSGLTKTKKAGLLVTVAFIMGLLITIAEPDLTVLAKHTGELINGRVLVITIGVGVGLLLMIAILRIIFKKSLSMILLFLYLMAFGLAAVLADGIVVHHRIHIARGHEVAQPRRAEEIDGVRVFPVGLGADGDLVARAL